VLVACMVGFGGTMDRVGEVMYEAGYVCVQLPGEYVLEVGS